MIDFATEPFESDQVIEEPISDSNVSPLDLEIREIITDLNELTFAERIGINTSNRISVEPETIQFSDSEYNLEKGYPVKDLEIELGTSKLPRFQCACHKLNIAVRLAIEKSPEISEILKSLCCSNAQVRR